MKTILRKELYPVMLVLAPFAYLGIIYNSLPAKVPIHWNIRGEIDRFGDKSELLLIAAFPLLIYLIFTIAPKMDPKNKVKTMGKKYQRLKILLVIFMSALAIYILYSISNQTLSNPNLIILSLGILYTILGNYFKTIKANYVIGIRTPWTLRSETVWTKTHILGGKLWFVGGLIIIISSLVVSRAYTIYLFLAITAVITLIPAAYSYVQFKKLNKLTES